jgi:predicted TIM-barrel fold metal-dependent hydrolase
MEQQDESGIALEQRADIHWDGGGARRIIDAHAHIFPPLHTGSQEIVQRRLRHWQFHLQDCPFFWRKTDGQRVSAPLLALKSPDISEMPDVNFRLTDFGQAECTIDRVDYVLQFYSPSLINLESPPERMIGEMTLAGVMTAIIHADSLYGDLNDYVAAASRAFPGRFVGLAQVWEPEADQPAQIERVRRAVTLGGHRGLYFSVESFAFAGSDSRLDDPRFDALWRTVQELGIPIFWYIEDRTSGPRNQRFIGRVAELDRWANRYPDIPCVITHGLAPAAIVRSEGYPIELIKLLGRPNVHGEVVFPSLLGDYPYPKAGDYLRFLRDELGAEKLLWGSDSPLGLTYWCTYVQAIDVVRVHAHSLTQVEKNLVLGGNAARLLKLDPPTDPSP